MIGLLKLAKDVYISTQINIKDMKEKTKKEKKTILIVGITAASLCVVAAGMALIYNARKGSVDPQDVQRLQQQIKELETENRVLKAELGKLYKKLSGLLYHLGRKTAEQEIAVMRK